jgi:hypothetical protein
MSNWCLQGLGHDNTYSARAHEFCNCGQQVDGEYEQHGSFDRVQRRALE